MTTGHADAGPSPSDLRSPSSAVNLDRQRQERTNLLDLSPAALLAINLNGEVVACNDRVQEWFGSGGQPNALIGRNLMEWLTPASRLLYETQVMPRLLEAGLVREVVLEMRNDAGKRKTLLVSASLHTHADGERRVYLAVIDASERISFEHELMVARRDAEVSHLRLALLQDATSRLAVASGFDDLGATLVATAGQASISAWTAVRLADPRNATDERRYGALPPGIPHSITAGGPEQAVFGRSSELTEQFPDLAASFIAAGIENLVITPIARMDQGGTRTVYGEIICASLHQHSLEEDELETLRALAAQAERVVEHLRLQERLRYQALHDGLTSLPNRLLFTERLAQMLAAAAQSGDPCAVCFVDLDGFKTINDQRGHAAGDEVLRLVAERLRNTCRAEDTVSRFGGDEFVVAAQGLSEQAAAEFAQRLHQAIRAPLEGDANGLSISSSIGMTHWSPGRSTRTPSAAEFIAAADAAMYATKLSGKDSVTINRWVTPKPTLVADETSASLPCVEEPGRVEQNSGEEP